MKMTLAFTAFHSPHRLAHRSPVNWRGLCSKRFRLHCIETDEESAYTESDLEDSLSY